MAVTEQAGPGAPDRAAVSSVVTHATFYRTSYETATRTKPQKYKKKLFSSIRYTDLYCRNFITSRRTMSEWDTLNIKFVLYWY